MSNRPPFRIGVADDHSGTSNVHGIVDTTQIVPTGITAPYAGTGDPPAGWLWCDGSAVSRATYSTLFSRIGVQYGAGNGTTTFNLPNFEGRVPVGKSTGADFDTLGKTGGSIAGVSTHTHTVDHTHSSFNATSGNESVGHSHTGTTGSTSVDHTHGGYTSTVDINHTHSGTTDWMDRNNTHNHGGGTTGRSADHSHGYSRGELYSGGFASGSIMVGQIQYGWNGYGTGGESVDHSHGIYSSDINHLHGFTTGWMNQNNPHSHTVTTNSISATAHTHSFTTGSTVSANHTHTTAISVPQFTGSSGSAGTDNGNLQPYITMRYIIKT